jgi:outer membrane murein-binding lipoprotein Lpp
MAAAEDQDYDRRLGQVETDIQLLGASVENVGRDLNNFRRDWSDKAEEDRQAHRSARLTFPQLVTMIGTAVVVTAALFGGLMFLINGQIATVRLDLASQVAQVGLAVRGQGDGVTATQTAIQVIQREQASDRVKLGLVEQLSFAHRDFIAQAQGYDAIMARHDERLRNMERLLHELAARRPP